MRIVVPYVEPMLNHETYRSVVCSGIPTMFVQLDRLDEGAYGRLFRRLWSEGQDTIVCEHDVVPSTLHWQTLQSCNHDWCSYSYDDNLYPEAPMFGLARFSGRVMRAHPHAADDALVVGKRRDMEAEWWRIDGLIARNLQVRHVPWHMHTPDVRHVHIGPPSGPK